jgi:hypothetical protein
LSPSNLACLPWLKTRGCLPFAAAANSDGGLVFCGSSLQATRFQVPLACFDSEVFVTNGDHTLVSPTTFEIMDPVTSAMMEHGCHMNVQRVLEYVAGDTDETTAKWSKKIIAGCTNKSPTIRVMWSFHMDTVEWLAFDYARRKWISVDSWNDPTSRSVDEKQSKPEHICCAHKIRFGEHFDCEGLWHLFGHANISLFRIEAQPWLNDDSVTFTFMFSIDSFSILSASKQVLRDTELPLSLSSAQDINRYMPYQPLASADKQLVVLRKVYACEKPAMLEKIVRGSLTTQSSDPSIRVHFTHELAVPTYAIDEQHADETFKNTMQSSSPPLLSLGQTIQSPTLIGAQSTLPIFRHVFFRDSSSAAACSAKASNKSPSARSSSSKKTTR